MAKFSDDQLLSMIRTHEAQAMGGSTQAASLSTPGTTVSYGPLDVERAQAMDYYHGRPIGNEMPDRSQVVSQDVRDVIEWIKPQILRMFLDTDDLVRFSPRNPQDEQQAEQESDVINYVLMEQNNGAMVLHDVLMDALLLKNGYVKVWWDYQRHEETEKYTGLSEDQLTYTIQQIEQDGDEATIVGKQEKDGFVQLPDGTQQPVVTYDVTIQRMRKEGRVFAECVAPEDILVSPRTRGDLQDSPFVAHKLKLTRSELKERYKPDDEEGSTDADVWNIQSIARSDTVDELAGRDDTIDKSMQEVDVLECYMRVDDDGDGFAELRKIVRAGSKIVTNEGVPEVPFAYAVPVRMPHRHLGISLFDLLKDIQDIKTTLIRQTLDNSYLVNNGRVVVNDANVNIQDLLVSRPGGIVRTSGMPMQDVSPLQTQPIAQMLLPVVEYVDSITAQRTGISPSTQGLDPDTLTGSTAQAYNNAMNAATGKVELMARLFAECVRQMAILAHGCFVRNQDKPLILKLRNTWVPVDPTTWRQRFDCTVNVGLGTGSRSQMRSNLMLMGQMQQAAAQVGIVQPANVYALASQMAKVLGFKNPEDFFTDPSSRQFQQQQAQKQQAQPDPKVQAAQITQQGQIAKAKLTAQADLAEIAAQTQMHERELQLQAQIEAGKAGADLQKATMGAHADVLQAGLMAQQRHEQAVMQSAQMEHQTEQQREATFLKALQATGAQHGA
ncbi:MAG: portal protein [Vulcanimicrobiaceae bacterium]